MHARCLVLPVRRVSVRSGSARVEQRTDLDKLVLDIETNGMIDAEEAVRTAAEILMEQLSVFARLQRHAKRRLRRRATAGWIRCCCARSTIWN